VGTCAYIIAGNFAIQQLLALDQAVYDPSYDLRANEGAIVAGTGLGLSGLGAVAHSDLGLLGKALLGTSVSSPAWVLDLTQLLPPGAAQADLLCQ
jgi:hypothetical protein